MHLRFFGTRGSIATPGSRTLRYGGNTSCVQVRSAAGTLVLLDCGTGAHAAGQALIEAAQGEPIRGHILIGHTHWDHIQGIPFFAPLFVKGNEWDIYAPRGLGASLREALAGQMQYTYFPVALDELGAGIRYHELVEGEFRIGDIAVRTQYLNHTALCLGYRLQADGASVVYACDHEPHARTAADGEGAIGAQDQRHAAFLRGADLVIHDAQYIAAEYPKKQGWGHSTVEYAARMAELAGARRLALTHHDPLRSDEAVERVMADLRASLAARGSALEVFAAAEGQDVELAGDAGPAARAEPAGTPSAAASAVVDRTAAFHIADPALRERIETVLAADAVAGGAIGAAEDAAGIVERRRPSLVLLQHDPPGQDALALCRMIRAGGAYGAEVPVVLIAAREETAAGAAAGVSDWLVTPFSQQYARTRVRAWLMRAACGWVRPPLPANEEARVAALRRLAILDTPPEERFDRLTRIAAAAFGVSGAFVSLIDRERQWIKSARGSDLAETTREASFCGHVVASGLPEVVPDAFADPRFADNPAVSGVPHVRFYAGHPLVLEGGLCIGTLCLVDPRPRLFDEAQRALLADLAELVRRELLAPPG